MSSTLARPTTSQSDSDQINFRLIRDQLKLIQFRLELMKVENPEVQALRTGLTVAQSALESLIK